MSVYEFLRTIAAQLGDDRPGSPFRRYALKDLVAYYGEAMCFVATHRPDLFTDFTVMKLETGSSQDARCCGCTNVLGVVAQIDADGNTIKDLASANSESSADKSRWYRAPCKVTSGGTTTPLITTITVEPGMNGVFSVTPPVPPGVDMWVKLKCVHAPPSPDEASVLAGGMMGDCKFGVAIRSYVLYRALQGDRHAVGASSEAQNELKNVYTYLGMQLKMEKAQENE
jgi:hypothetical protein